MSNIEILKLYDIHVWIKNKNYSKYLYKLSIKLKCENNF